MKLWHVVIFLLFGWVSGQLNKCAKKQSVIFCLKNFKSSWKNCVENIDVVSGCYQGFCANFEACSSNNQKVNILNCNNRYYFN